MISASDRATLQASSTSNNRISYQLYNRNMEPPPPPAAAASNKEEETKVQIIMFVRHD